MGWDADYADRLAKRFALPLRTRVGQLSRGLRSALGVTIGLASRAPITMFDESYLGMDAPSRFAFYDELLADGATVIGPAAEVDRVTEGLPVLGAKHLGPTKAVTVYGELDEVRRATARDAGLEIGPVALQDLFVHLTDSGGLR